MTIVFCIDSEKDSYAANINSCFNLFVSKSHAFSTVRETSLAMFSSKEKNGLCWSCPKWIYFQHVYNPFLVVSNNASLKHQEIRIIKLSMSSNNCKFHVIRKKLWIIFLANIFPDPKV